MPTCDQPGKCKIMFDAPMFLGMPAIQYTLYALPKIPADKRLVFAGVNAANPPNFSHVKPLSQHRMDRAHRLRLPTVAIDQPSLPRLLRSFFQGQCSSRVPLELLRNERSGLGVRVNDLL